MAIYKVRNLGKIGVISDIPPYDLPIEAWTDAKNVRFVANRVEKVGGYTPAMVPTKDKTIPMIFCQEPESEAILFATEKNIYRYEQAIATPISKGGVPYTDVSVSTPWDYCTLSNCVIFSAPNQNPQGWLAGYAASTGRLMVDIPGWGAGKTTSPTTKVDWKCKRMRSYKNYLIALNMIEDGHAYPQRLRWSDSAEVNAFPPNWFEDGPNTDGGFVDLSDCTGSIIDGRPLRDYFLIYTDRETYIMRFVGGDFVFDIQKLFPDSGVLNANCVCEYEGGNHFVISQEDIFTHDGSSKQSIATDIIKEKLFSELTAVNYAGAKVFSYPSRKEIWVTYPNQAAEEGDAKNFACDKAAIWNWKTGAWSFTDLPGTYWIDEVSAPDSDTRSWAAPDRSGSTPIKPITKITLDSPVYHLAVGDKFRMDVIYEVGEGLVGNQTLVWTSSDPSIADFDAPGLDGSANLIAKKIGGPITITAKLSTNNAITTSYDKISVVAAGSLPADRHQVDDNNVSTGSIAGNMAGDDKNEPTPYRPNQPTDPANQWEILNPDGTPNSPGNSHANEQWEKKGYSFTSRAFIGCSEDGNFYFLDTGTVQERADKDGLIVSKTPVVSEITKYSISFSEVEDGLFRHKTFRTLYPLISGEGTLRFNIGGSNDAYVQPSFRETIQFKIGQDYKVDCFTNYRYLAYSIRDENEGSWSFSGMDIDYFLGGNR